MGRDKPFADGGGLCSPGRWSPSSRVQSNYGLDSLRGQLFDLFERSVKDELGRKCSVLDFVLRLCAGRFGSSPFGEEVLHEARTIIDRTLSHGGLTDPPQGQCFHLDLIS